MSADLDRFLQSNFFGNPFNAWHDGLDTHLLTALQGEDRLKAEEILLKALPDHRAVAGLGELRSQKAIEPLRQLINSSVSKEAAVALKKITGESSGLDSLIASLKNRSLFWSDRMDAAIALHHFRDEKAVNALLDALDDPEGLVRNHAAESLLILYGQIDADTPGIMLPSAVTIRIMRDNERAAAAEELRQMVRQGKLKES
ncbi:MAG TPA: hypothetical protein VHD90_04425 [Phototrophicaceae bacterium]|nr:hypothetical protein [Phototrophicaceae bacterium]